MSKADFREKYLITMEAIKKSRSRYNENLEVIDRLKKMLKTCDMKSKLLIKSSIEKVEKEQNDIIKQQRTNLYRLAAMEGFNSKEDKNTKIDKNNNVVYDKSDVTITDVKEDTHLKVINITGEEEKQSDDITEVLKKEEISEKQLEDIKIVFDGSYKLIYNRGKSIYERESNDVLLDLSIDDQLKNHNYNITNLLRYFDNENGTNLMKKYENKEIDVYYNFDKVNNKESKNLYKKTKKVAKKEAKNNDRIRIIDNKFKKVRTTLAFAATAGIMLFGSAGISKFFNKNNKSIDSYSKSNSIETVYEAGESDASYEAVKLENTSMITSIPNLELENNEKDVEDNKVDSETNNKPEYKVEETRESDNMKIGDLYSLDSVDLYHASTDKNPLGNTCNIEKNHSFKTNLIAVVYNNQVIMNLNYSSTMDVEELESISKEKYGDDIKIFINFNELDKEGNLVTENVGWVLKEEVISKGKVLTR